MCLKIFRHPKIPHQPIPDGGLIENVNIYVPVDLVY